jgi:DNA-binding NarL/FixJ family response regulator
MIRVLLADNQAIFRAGTTRVLEAQDDIDVLGQCEDPLKVTEMVASNPPCVLILAESLRCPLDRLLAAAATAGSRVILMTDTSGEPEASIVRRLDGLLTRHASTSDLLSCVRLVGNGERAVGSVSGSDAADAVGQRMREVLTARELQIIGLVVQGMKNRQIADELGTKEQVIKNYLRSIYDKTGSSDRLELALFTLHHRVLAEAAAKASGTMQLRSA